MTCELKFVYPGHTPDVRYATCTHPGHTWAMVAPGTGTAKAKVEHGKHLCVVEVADGFGHVWTRCDRPDCDLEVVRPGKAQCHGRCQEVAD